MNWLRKQKVIQFIREAASRLLPGKVKDFIKKRIAYPLYQLLESGNTIEGKKHLRTVIYPQLPWYAVKSILNSPFMPVDKAQVDIICFSIIDWDFRFQRPQQIMTQFAKNGHRVFYISISAFLSENSSSKFEVRKIQSNIFEVTMAVHEQPNIYGECLSDKNLEVLLDSLDGLRQSYGINEAISYVMIASWTDLALQTSKWGWQILYDCMDEWEDFPLITPAILQAERELVQYCDLLIVTGQQLYNKWIKLHQPIILARNATDYQFYIERYHANEIITEVKHPIVGYYGAIADWFDIELMVYIAKSRPQYTYVLLGGVFDVDVSQLQSLPNVRILGQQPYETMPLYLYHFDVAIIPFKVNAITQATDPVKLYEYLTGGKPVVSVALSELLPYQELVYLATDYNNFLSKLDEAVSENQPDLIEKRKAFARQNSWESRYERIIEGLREINPKASIVIVSFNNLAFTRLCIESILQNTAYPNYEIIVVDNNSSDNTSAYLRAMAAMYDHIKIIYNPENMGFAKANNQGIDISTGEYLVLLNNDTIVPPAWLSRLIYHLKDPEIGLVGSTTNSVFNEAQIYTSYVTWAEMEGFAQYHMWKNSRQIANINMLAMYCVAFRRDTYNEVGPLDERFGIGMFEDDDYSLRIRKKNYKVVCAIDVFVHHFGQASFKKLRQDDTYNNLFQENLKKYEQKWQIKWVPHRNTVLKPYLHDFDLHLPDKTHHSDDFS